MKIPTRPRSYGLKFSVTALIDIVFLLIIFFLAANHLVSRETEKKVDLSRLERGADETSAGPKIVITIDADRRLSVGGAPVGSQQIADRIADGGATHGESFAVFIRAERTTPYSVIEEILQSCATAGVRKVYYAYSEL